MALMGSGNDSTWPGEWGGRRGAWAVFPRHNHPPKRACNAHSSLITAGWSPGTSQPPSSKSTQTFRIVQSTCTVHDAPSRWRRALSQRHPPP
eukprot:359808-Chlamydomonas_euryale.AAC.3